jgi:cell division protein FtsB
MVSAGALRKLLIAGLVGITAYILLMGDYSIFHVASHVFRKQEMLEEISSMEAVRDSLIEERKRVEEDSLELERLAREKIGMVREGERVFKAIVVDGDSLPLEATADTLHGEPSPGEGDTAP